MYGKIRKIHFIGIGGIGMSGIAEILVNMGYKISGSDINSTESTKRLENLGIDVSIGHTAENISGSDVVVISSAISNDNPEVIQAINSNIPVIPRAEMLAELMRLKYGIAIIGSHGKTTTTSMVSAILSYGDFDPTIVVGGRVKTLGTNAKLGKGDFMVVEADESDGSFQKLSPVISILTNIDEEHLDHYQTIENLENAFLNFLEKIPFYGLSVLCADCPRTKKLISKLNKRFISYGTDNLADLYANNIKVSGFKTYFDVNYKNKKLGDIELEVPGRHNALNALSAVAVGLELGMNFEDIRNGFKDFHGIERRLQLKGEIDNILVIDDYGHHPVEIKATLNSIEEAFSKKPVVIFQPHRFSRTYQLFDEFVDVLSSVANLFVLDIYPAGEKAIEGINSKKLVEAISKNGNESVYYVKDQDELISKVKSTIKSGDIVLTSGAGNVWMHGEKLLSEMQK